MIHASLICVLHILRSISHVRQFILEDANIHVRPRHSQKTSLRFGTVSHARYLLSQLTGLYYLDVCVNVCSYSLGEEFGVVVAGECEEALGAGVELGDDVVEGLGADDGVLGEPVVLYRPARQTHLTAQVLKVQKHVTFNFDVILRSDFHGESSKVTEVCQTRNQTLSSKQNRS